MTEKKYPTRSQFLLCEDVRLELSQKVTLIGVFGGDDLQLKQKVPRDKKAALDRLVVYSRFFGGDGEFFARAELHTPDGQVLKQDLDASAKTNKGSVHAIVIQFSPFGIHGFGNYKLAVYLDDQSYEYVFELKGEYES